jgi:hypothetical protein
MPSSVESLARIWGLGARRAGKFTVVVSIVRLPQSSADDGANRHGQTYLLVGYWSGAAKEVKPSRHWAVSLIAGFLIAVLIAVGMLVLLVSQQ